MFITVSGQLSPEEVAFRHLWSLDDGPPENCLQGKLPHWQFPLQQIPRMIVSWVIAHEECCTQGNLPKPRTRTLMLLKNINFEENPRQLLS